MERTTVYLPVELKQRLAVAARARGTTEAEVIREALARALDEVALTLPDPVGRSVDGGVARDVAGALARSGFGREGRRETA